MSGSRRTGVYFAPTEVRDCNNTRLTRGAVRQTLEEAAFRFFPMKNARSIEKCFSREEAKTSAKWLGSPQLRWLITGTCHEDDRNRRRANIWTRRSTTEGGGGGRLIKGVAELSHLEWFRRGFVTVYSALYSRNRLTFTKTRSSVFG